jgi:hypothetical protein
MIRLAKLSGLLTILAVLTTLAGGCAKAGARGGDQPYQSLKDIDLARRTADLVVEGTVTETLAGDRQPVDSFFRESVLAGNPSTAATSNTDCIVKTRVTLDVARVVKSASTVSGPVRFWFESPCYPDDPAVLLGTELPDALTRGRPMRVYLVDRGGQWWLIAHERWNGSIPEPTSAPPTVTLVP